MDTQIAQKILSNGLDIRKIGFDINMGGFILVDKDKKYLISFPDEDEYEAKDLIAIAPDSDEYNEIIKQMDISEIELIDNDPNKKVIVRKSQRQLDQLVTWKVFERDNYTCRYCGRKGIPMTYDHVKLWENKGENSVENGVCACKKCNKTRGNMDYEDWMNSKYYEIRSENLSPSTKHSNRALINKYKSFPDKISKRKR